MADIAEIGFSANTSELVDAKSKMEGLVPAAGRAERAADRLNKMLDAGSRAALAAARADVEKANAVLSAAKATGTATKEEIASAAAAKRKAQAVYDAAKASRAQKTASDSAAAALKKEADALNAAATAANRYNTAAGKRTSVPSVGMRPDLGQGPRPWGDPNPPPVPNNDNKPKGVWGNQSNPANIAAQFQDIGVTAAMGMHPIMIAFQQGTQLAMAMGGGVKALAAAFGMLLGPTQLFIIAMVALVAAAIQMVNWTKVAQTVLNGLAAILPELAIGVTLLGTALTVAFAPAIVIAFWNVFLMVAAGIAAAVGTIVATVGAIPLAIGLIIADLYIFRDEWAQVLGFDLIAVVKDGVNLIIGAFVGAYHDIEFLWKQFPDVIGAAAIGAANLAIKAVNAIIGASVAGLNLLIAQVNKIGAIGENLGFGFSIEEVDAGQFKFEEMANEAADRLAGAVGKRNEQLQKDLTTDYLGAIGGAITAGAEKAASKIREFSAGLGADAAKKKGGGKTEAEKFEDIINGAERTIASLQAEKDAIGLSAEATARLRYETDLLNQARQKGIELGPAQREQLLSLAADMARLEVETQRAKEALDFAKDATKGFIGDLKSGLMEGKSLWESFINAALNLANKLIDRGLNAIIDKLFEVNAAQSGLGGGSGGGFLGSLLGGIGKLFGFAKGGAFSNGISGYSNTIVDKPTLFAFASGAGVMGEAGPEAIMPLKRGPDGSLGVQMHNGSGSTQQQVNNRVEVVNQYKIEGALSEEKVVAQIRASGEQTKEDVKQSVMGWLGEYQRNGIMGT